MGDADQQQHEQPPKIEWSERLAALLRAQQLDRKAEAEEKREQGEELPFGEDVDRLRRDLIEQAGGRGGRRLADRGRFEERHIDQQNTEECKTAQDVDGCDTLVRRQRPSGGW